MSKFTFDKKQLPQIIVLGVLALGLVGYFLSKLIAAPPTQAAGTPAPAASTASTSSSTSDTQGAKTGAPDAPDSSALIGAGAPTDGMHDPFLPDATPAPAVTTPPAQLPISAAAQGEVPTVPGLPSMSQVQPLSVPGTGGTTIASGWAVTGIIASDADPSEAVAIFRFGDERKYVRLGNLIDESSRLIGIDRDGVTVLHHGERIRLPLGGPPPDSKTGAPASIGAPQMAPVPAPVPTAEPSPAPQQKISLPSWVRPN